MSHSQLSVESIIPPEAGFVTLGKVAFLFSYPQSKDLQRLVSSAERQWLKAPPLAVFSGLKGKPRRQRRAARSCASQPVVHMICRREAEVHAAGRGVYIV